MIFNHAVNTSTARKQLWKCGAAAVEAGPKDPSTPSGQHTRETALHSWRPIERNKWLAWDHIRMQHAVPNGVKAVPIYQKIKNQQAVNLWCLKK